MGVVCARRDLSLFAFAGIWCNWHAVRGTKKNPEEGEHRLYGFLTTDLTATCGRSTAKPCQPS